MSISSHNRFFLIGFLGCLILSGCRTEPPLAPIVSAWQEGKGLSQIHHVQDGETLYAIAFRYGLDFRELANKNRLQPPYALHAGQVLNVSSLHKTAGRPFWTHTVRPEGANDREVVSHRWRDVHSSNSRWHWPTKGQVIRRFGAMSKGIDIEGRQGQDIRSAAAGEVVYSGDGLRGYGNLIIIKHDEETLSAYAHNKRNWVKEGQKVKASQKIAEMGKSGSNRVCLHFEIRRQGQAMDPLRLLGPA